MSIALRNCLLGARQTGNPADTGLHPALDDLLGQVRRVVRDTAEAAGPPGVLPGQADEAQAGHARHAAVMRRIAAAVEDGHPDPAVVPGEAGAPDHGTDPLQA